VDKLFYNNEGMQDKVKEIIKLLPKKDVFAGVVGISEGGCCYGLRSPADESNSDPEDRIKRLLHGADQGSGLRLMLQSLVDPELMKAIKCYGRPESMAYTESLFVATKILRNYEADGGSEKIRVFMKEQKKSFFNGIEDKEKNSKGGSVISSVRPCLEHILSLHDKADYLVSAALILFRSPYDDFSDPELPGFMGLSSMPSLKHEDKVFLNIPSSVRKIVELANGKIKNFPNSESFLSILEERMRAGTSEKE